MLDPNVQPDTAPTPAPLPEGAAPPAEANSAEAARPAGHDEQEYSDEDYSDEEYSDEEEEEAAKPVLSLPGPWFGNLTLKPPRLPHAIKWQIRIQSMGPEGLDLPELVLAAAGVVCPELPDRKRREDWLDYGDRVSDALAELVPGEAPIEVYNHCHEAYRALRHWLTSGSNPEDVAEVEAVKNT